MRVPACIVYTSAHAHCCRVCVRACTASFGAALQHSLQQLQLQRHYSTDACSLLCLQKVYVSTFVRRGANLGNKLCKYDKAC